MEIETSINDQGQVYIPSKIKKAIGLIPNKKIILIGNARSIFLIPLDMTPEEALGSLEVIEKHLKHRVWLRKENSK